MNDDRRQLNGDRRNLNDDRRNLNDDRRNLNGDRRNLNGDYRNLNGDYRNLNGDCRNLNGDRPSCYFTLSSSNNDCDNKIKIAPSITRDFGKLVVFDERRMGLPLFLFIGLPFYDDAKWDFGRDAARRVCPRNEFGRDVKFCVSTGIKCLFLSFFLFFRINDFEMHREAYAFLVHQSHHVGSGSGIQGEMMEIGGGAHESVI